MTKNKTNHEYFTPIQMKFPVDLEKIIKISDPIYAFNEIMNEVDLRKYLVVKGSKVGRPRLDSIKLLKIILFAFMEFGYVSLRRIEMDVQQFTSDMDCFIPLMEKFHRTYGFYPKYPVADAG